MFVSVSLKSLSRILREVTYLPSHNKIHCNGRLVDLYERKRLNAVERAERFADVDVLDAAYAHEVAQSRLVALDALQALKLIELSDFYVLCGAVGMAERHGLAVLYPAALNSADAYPSHEVVGVDV